ncbi:MAG: metallophosphoesterase [Nitrospirae bacterium]|nr:metallophosphoesterase [Nitrospirota bacterium]
MAYRIMIIDDAPSRRKEQYMEVFSIPEFEPLYIWTHRDFEKYRNTPVDGYVIDVFLDEGDWSNINAAELLKSSIQEAPRAAPIFLISQLWGDERVLEILKQVGESSAKVVQYLAWSEFIQATGQDEAAKARMDALRNKLLFELDHWHGRSGFRPNPDDAIRILLLADVQFGDPATDPKATFAEHWIVRALRQEGLLPDLIVVAGDLSHSGRPDQFLLAEERLALDLIGPLWGNTNIERMRDRIVLVPGNHDVNLRFSACDKRKFNLETKDFETDNVPAYVAGSTHSPRHHDYALEPFRRFAHRLTSDRNWAISSSLSWVDRRFLHCGIRFFVMNSVAELGADTPDHASFSESALREINRSLGDDDPEAVFSIAISHHGLRSEGASTKERQVDNWLTVGRDVFSMHKIRLWLYGHYHEFDARSLNSEPFDKAPLWLVQAPTSRIGFSTRGFCVIELIREKGNVIDAHAHHYVLEKSTTTKKSIRKVFAKG